MSGEELLNALILFSAMSKNSDSELITITVCENIVDITLAQGDSESMVSINLTKLTSQNAMQAMAEITTLAKMEHAGAKFSNKTLH